MEPTKTFAQVTKARRSVVAHDSSSVTQDELRASSSKVVSDSNAFKGYPQNGGTDYFMDCEQRGWAYVFNLAGEMGDSDAERLEKTLKDKWYFHVVVQDYNDWECVREFLQNIDEKVTDNEDCLLIAVLYNENCEPSDSLENVWKIFTKVDNNLVTKPKIFIFNDYKKNQSKLQADSVESNMTPDCVPSHSDFLFIYGYGVDYITKLCTEIDKAASENVYNLITRANNCSSSAHFNSTLLYTLKFSSSTKMELNQQRYSEKVEERKNQLNSAVAKDAATYRSNLIEEIKTYCESQDEKSEAKKNANRILKKLDEEMALSKLAKMRTAFDAMKSMESNLQ